MMTPPIAGPMIRAAFETEELSPTPLCTCSGETSSLTNALRVGWSIAWSDPWSAAKT